MRVKYKDLETGQTAWDENINEFSLCEGSWSCDCNRMIAFDRWDDSDFCTGCNRYIVIDIDADISSDEKARIIAEANREYKTEEQ